MHPRRLQMVADALIRAVARDGAEIRWHGGVIEITQPDGERITIMVEVVEA